MHRISLWSALLFIAMGSTLTAESLTLDQAVERALTHNLGLQSQDASLGAKKVASDFSYNRLYPSVQFSGGLNVLTSPDASKALAAVAPVTTTAGALKAPYLNNVYVTPDATTALAGLTIQWPLTVAAFEGMAQAAVDYRNAVVGREQAARGLKTGVSKAYFQLVVLQESIRLTERQLSNADERLRQVSVSNQAGQATELSLLQAQMARHSVLPVLQAYRQNSQQALLALESQLGMDPDPTVTLTDTLPTSLPLTVQTVDQVVERGLSGNLDRRALIGNLDALVQQRRSLDAALYPSLVLQYSADPALNNPFNVDLTDGNNWKQRSGGLLAQVVWKLDPWLPGSSYWVNSQALDAQQTVARLSLDQSRRKLQTDALNLLDTLARAQDNLATWTEIAREADRAVELMRAAYASGSKSLLDVNDAELSAQSAQVNLLGVRQTLYSTWLDLQDLQGQE
ncbi:MAG: TolC family protein [Spirochaetales bacterium]